MVMLYVILGSLVISGLLVGLVYEKISTLKVIILGIVNYFFFYILCSGFLFWCDMYSIWKGVLLSLTLLILAALGAYCWKKQLPVIYWDKKEALVMTIILFVVLPMTIKNFGFFGMGQDQGVYQTKAIELINNNNQRIFDFDEYNELETEEQRESYYGMVLALLGYYLEDEETTLQHVEGISDVAGIYHGIPTWPAILALFGKILGISHMQDCQSLFFILFLMIVYYSLQNHNIRFAFQLASVLLLGLSPQIIWVSKSALTEMFLSIIFACFYMLITEKNKDLRYFSCIPIVVYSFYHVTIYTMLPMFLIIYWGLYLITKNKKYIFTCNISILGYLLGFFFMLYISPYYTTFNHIRPLSKLMFLKFVNDNNLIFLGAISAVVAFLITNIVLVTIVSKNKITHIRKICFKHRSMIYKALVCILLVVFIILSIKRAARLENLGNFTLISMMFATGVFLLPASIVMIFVLPKDKMRGENLYVIFTSFLYAVLFYGVFLRLQCQFYFYYGRYLVPLLFIIVVLFCILFNDFEHYYLAILAYSGAIFFVEPDFVLATQRDDTYITWEVFEGVLDAVSTTNSAVIIPNNDATRLLFLPIKSAGSAVYNEWSSIDQEINFLLDKYDSVYYVADRDAVTASENYFVPIYKAYNKASEDHQTALQMLTKYPVEFKDIGSYYAVYEYREAKLSYNITDEDFEGTGFGVIESNLYAWMYSEKATVNCYLNQESYMVALQGTEIPLTDLNLEQYDVNIYINDKYCTTLSIESSNNGKVLYFYIPEELIHGRKNIMTFECELWSPTDYGSSDTRKLGFGFLEMTFFENGKKDYDLTESTYIRSGFGD